MNLVGIILLVVLGTVVSVIAQVTTTVDPIQIINQGNELVNAIATKSVGYGSGAGMIVYFLINLLKMKVDKNGKTLADKVIPKRYRPLVAAIAGVVGGIAGTILTGGTLPIAIMAGITGGALPTLIHEIVNTTIKDSKNK